MTLPVQPFGLSAQGFRSKRLADIKEELDNAMQAEFGAINLAPQSVFGQIVGVMAKAYSDLWENFNFVYASQYPNSAFGISLDNVVGLNGITRIAETQTFVWASCGGNEGTTITANALARVPNTNDVFYAETGGVITASSADFVNIAVGTLAAQIYTVSLNSIAYIYSLPIITFTGSFAFGNNTVVYINGVGQASVPFNTDTTQTVMDIAAVIALNDNVLSATPAGSVINVVPDVGKQVTINLIDISGGAPPTYAITFDTPATTDEVSQALTDVINAGTPNWVAVDDAGTFNITTTDPVVPFAVGVGVNLSITSFTTAIKFLAQQYGPVACPEDSLTEIVTPIGGWNSINNREPGVLGRFTETDAELRLRRQRSLALFGLATVEAMRSHLINLPNVTAVSIEENVSLQETPLVITWNNALIAGQQIDVTYNGGGGTFSVPFNMDMATTMADLATQFLTLPAVATAIVSGGDLVITLTFNPAQELVIVSGNVVATGTGTLPQAVVVGGQPPKSVQATVQGGTNQDIANEIWRTKPAGIETFGNVNVIITDSQGNEQSINFSRPVPVYIWVGASLDLYLEETFPVNGDQLVAQAIFAYGETLGVGMDVLIQRVESQVFKVPGIGEVIMQLAATVTPTGSPSFAMADIPIASNQISSWSLDRIAVAVI